MVGTNRSVLEGWVLDLEEDKRQEFIDNLADILKEAENVVGNAGTADMSSIINKYKDIKTAKYNQGVADKFVQKITRLAWLAAAMAAATIACLFSLVLIMLSIERNTRAFQNGGSVLATEKLKDN